MDTDSTENITDNEIENLKKIQAFTNEIISKKEMSPEQEQQLHDMIKNLKTSVQINEDTLKKFRKYWDIKHNELPKLHYSLDLEDGESIYYKFEAQLLKKKKKLFRPNKIDLKVIDKGNVYLTNKNIVFEGENINKKISFIKVMFILTYTDRIEFLMFNHKSLHFICENPDEVRAYSSRFLKECSSKK